MKTKNILLGVGFDAQNGHKRISRGKNFYIFGGSKTTHQLMQESCIKFNEELDKRRKNLDGISHKEFYDIAHKVKSKLPKQKGKG